MDAVRQDQKAVLPYLLRDEEHTKELELLFAGKPLEDKQLQEKLVAQIVQASLSEELLFTSEYPNARGDLSRYALSMLGMNNKGELFTEDETLQNKVPALLNTMLHNGKQAISDDFVAELLAYSKSAENSLYHAKIQQQLGRYLTETQVARLNELIRTLDGETLSQEIAQEQAKPKESPEEEAAEPRPDVEELANKDEAKVESPEPNSDAEEPANKGEAKVESPNVEQGKKEAQTQDGVENEAPEQKAPTPSTVPGSKMTEEAYSKPSASVQPSAQDLYNPHVVSIELESELEEREQRLLRESDPMMQTRAFTTKVKDLVKYRAKDMFDPIPLKYPSEPLFGETLVHMDANGRASSEPLLQFKFGKVIMPSPKVDDSVYEIMAIRTLKNGIKKPFIRCDFSDPKMAQMFLTKTVDNLIAIGYDIEDMSVQPKMQAFFDALKASKLENQFTIEETVPELDLDQSNKVTEPAIQGDELGKNNEPVTLVSEQIRQDGPNAINVDQLKANELVAVLNADRETLTLPNQNAYDQIKGYVDKLFKKTGPKADRPLGPREFEKLSAFPTEVIQKVYGEKHGPRFEQVIENERKRISGEPPVDAGSPKVPESSTQPSQEPLPEPTDGQPVTEEDMLSREQPPLEDYDYPLLHQSEDQGERYVHDDFVGPPMSSGLASEQESLAQQQLNETQEKQVSDAGSLVVAKSFGELSELTADELTEGVNGGDTSIIEGVKRLASHGAENMTQQELVFLDSLPEDVKPVFAEALSSLGIDIPSANEELKVEEPKVDETEPTKYKR